MSNGEANSSMPAELRELGEMQRVFDSTPSSFGASLARGIFPITVSLVMVVIGEIWLVPRTWKYYLLVGIAIVMFLNGVRVVVQSMLRRNQKVALFEKGFALWRNDVLTSHRWDSVEQVYAVFSRGDDSQRGAMLSFTVTCKDEGDERSKVHFDPAGDPTANLLELYREMEERSCQSRIPAAIAKFEQGDTLSFGKELSRANVGPRVNLDKIGIHYQPRHGSADTLEWERVVSIDVIKGRLMVMEIEEEDPWLDVAADELPGSPTLVAVGKHRMKTVAVKGEGL